MAHRFIAFKGLAYGVAGIGLICAFGFFQPGKMDSSIDGGVLQVKMPSEDLTFSYVERSVFTVQMESESASIEGTKMYLGDGEIAIELKAHPSEGIRLQGLPIKQGHMIRKGDSIEVLPGYRKASELRSGDVYVTLPGVLFQLPQRKK